MDGIPQRPLRRFRVSALILGVVCLAALVRPVVAQTGFIPNGNFEDGATGWFVVGDLVMSVDTSVGGVDGQAALHLVAGTEGPHQVRSQYWLSGIVTPGAAYGLEAWVRDNDPGVVVTMRLEFLNAAGVPLGGVTTAPSSSDVPDFRRVQVQQVAPASSFYARVIFEGDFTVVGATFAVDGVVLAQVGAAPTVEPTQQPPPPTPAPVIATTAPTATPRATATPRPTATPKPPPIPIGPSLRLAHDGDRVAPWEVTRGSLEVAPAGHGLLFRADGESTAWIEQAVTVIPGGWYEGLARLTPIDGVRSAWVRIAWYASADASGAQIETDDSDAVLGDGVLAITVAGGLVRTGAVQAPAGARSAKVRVLLQAATASGASVVIEAIAFEQATAPPQTTPTPTPTLTPTVAPSATVPTPPSPSTTPAGGSATGAPVASPTRATAVPDALVEAQRALRITEVMPDPLQPGRDSEYEWVELTNLGPIEVALDGMLIRDVQAATALPSVVIAPGASIVVAGPLAEVDADVRLEGSIGNGLGNEGDLIELVDASGNLVDVFDYRPGTGLVAAPGVSIHRWFDHTGALSGAGAGVPSPGVHEPLVVAVDAPSNVASGVPTPAVGSSGEEGADAAVVVASGGDADVPAWVFLLAVAGGAAGGMAVQRISHRPSRPPES